MATWPSDHTGLCGRLSVANLNASTVQCLERLQIDYQGPKGLGPDHLPISGIISAHGLPSPELPCELSAGDPRMHPNGSPLLILVGLLEKWPRPAHAGFEPPMRKLS